MTDKEKQYLIAEIERLKDCASPIVVCDTLLSLIDSMQEDPCDGCTNRRGCITCENGELRETMQEEPVSERFAFKAIPRLLEMIEPTDRAKSYVVKLADAFDSEGYYTDAKIVRESLKIMNGEKVAMATMDEEPVSEKKCMYSKDNYTDEDRKVLCEGCEAKRKYSKQSVDEAMAEIEEKAKAFTKTHKGESADEILSEMRGKEPVSDDLEKVVEEIVDPIVLNVYGVKEIANRLRRTMIDSASEELEEVAEEYAYTNWQSDDYHDGAADGLPFDAIGHTKKTFIAGAQWQKQQFEKNRLKHCNSITNEQAELEQGFIDQHLNKYQRMPTFLDAIEYGMNLQKEQMMAKAIDGEIGYWNIRGLSVNMDLPRTLEEDDKVKLIIIKED